MRRRATVGIATMLIGAMLLLAGCATPSGAATPTPTPTATTPPPPPPPPNDLGAERVAQIAAECPDTIDAETVRMLVQPLAEAVSFFASTKQCGDIPHVLETGNGARAFVSPTQYIDAACPAGTLFTIWAHYDDDLIFGSPTIPEALDAGKCVRNLYLTGSDAGKGLDYAYGREDGLRDSYDVLLGAPYEWEQRPVTLANGLTVGMSRPIGDPRVSLYFLRLPDGGLDAGGFEATSWSSLPQLLNGAISELHMIDTGQAVSLDGVTSTIVELYNGYQPYSVMAHLPGAAFGSDGDHPDHQATGNIVMGAADAGQLDPGRVVYAQGYPSEFREQNLDGDLLHRKLMAFSAYATHDPVIRCSTPDSCLNVHRFGAWLVRQYLIPHGELERG